MSARRCAHFEMSEGGAEKLHRCNLLHILDTLADTDSSHLLGFGDF